MTFPVVGSNIPLPYQISNSLRFNDGDSPTLSRTPGSAGNRKTWTFSYWIKRSTISTVQQTFAVGTNAATPWFLNYINSDDTLHVWFHNGSSSYLSTSSNKLRDTSAWYHVVYFVDTTQATASDRFKVYVNNVEVTWSSYNAPAQNFDTEVNTTSTHYIGRAGNGQYFDGYIAETYFIDGQALTPSNFGEYDEDSGVWKPKIYEGTYGTNGFYLKFNNTGNLGEDSSGNDNTWTPTNLSGTTDVTTDTPTNNFATWNPLVGAKSGGSSLYYPTTSEGNLKIADGNAAHNLIGASTIGFTQGKFYAEFKLDSTGDTGSSTGFGTIRGLDSHQIAQYDAGFTNSYLSTGLVFTGASSADSGVTFTTTDTIGVAVDCDNGYIYYHKNGTYINSGNPASGSSGTGGSALVTANDEEYFFHCMDSRNGNRVTLSANFGNPYYAISSGNSDENGYGNFEYAPPSGYLALCTQNLATALSPTIDDGSQYFNSILYTGDGNASGARNITGVGFQPDWTWIKERNSVTYHNLFDSNRGAGYVLHSNVTDAEGNYTTYFTSFDSDGFTLENNPGSLNGSGDTYVAWNWLANGGTTSSNTDGDITSTVQVNTTSKFSIFTYTGNGNNLDTVGHGLGTTPDFCVIKGRSSGASGTQRWFVKVPAVCGASEILELDTSNAKGDSGNGIETMSSTTVTLGIDTGNANGVNESGLNYVGYAFASVQGYSKIGSYTGNGNADGTFVYTGFRPAFVIVKRTDTAKNWYMFDNQRTPNNVIANLIAPNLSDAEDVDTGTYIDFLSNGFKLRQDFSHMNASGSTQIYMAFAENPFVTSGATPVTAR